MFSVQDNGIGIETDDYERIFAVFKRLHTEKEYPGLGIGLSLAKRLVERHGGKIWVESTPGAGSIFYFSMKVYDEADLDRRAIDERTNEPAA